MNYFLLFLTNGVLGYFLQAIGYLLGIYAFVKCKFEFKQFFLMAVLFALVGFGVRQITVISFGFHTVIIMIAFILLAVLLMKTPIFMTAVGILVPSAAILVAEVINICTLSAFMGYDRVAAIVAGDGTVMGEVYKALAGIPTNLILLAIMLILYKVFRRPKKEQLPDGKDGAHSGTEAGQSIER